MNETSPLLPAWLVLPVAVLTLLVLGGQFWTMSAAAMDGQRKRLRQATTFMLMLLTPVAAYGFGIAAPARGREYVFVWVLIAALLFIIIMLALLDMLHSLRLYRQQMSQVRAQIARERAQGLAAALATTRAHERHGEPEKRRRDGETRP
jgi:hypothetical protein